MKPVIYQLVVRYFGNTRGANVIDGDIHENGCGQFADINDRAIAELGRLGVTHVWLTGVLRQATLTDHSSIGLPPDPPDIVKGRAGSFYAVRDYVPSEAWAYLIGRARQRNAAAFFMAESYPYPGSADPVQHQSQLIDAGFDAVYHSRAYDALKRIYQGHGVDADEREMSALDDRSRPHYLEYLENHDERRIPSPIVAHASPGDSGFGSSHAAHQLAPLQLLYSQGPVLVLNGQEVGEPGAGATGFKGDNGRTTLFDYWRMPSFARWVNDHAYDGGQLDSGSAALRRYYRDLLGLCQHPSITGSGYWGLGSRHGADHGPGVSKWLYAFARYAPGSGRLVLVVANFRPDSAEAGQLRVPRELTRAAGVADGTSLHVRLILNEEGAQNDAGPTLSVEALALGGFDARVANQSCNVYALDAG